MQNRGALWIFTILLALACLWQLSFSFFTSRLEGKAKASAQASVDSLIDVNAAAAAWDRDSLALTFENRYVRAHSEDEVYPLFGYTYSYCKSREMTMGLDLKGGMAVTLEVSVPELIVNLSENSQDAAFQQAIVNAKERQKTSNADFITLFGEEYNKIPGHGPLSAIFYTPERKDMFDREGTDTDYLAALRREADAALNNTERIMRTRIDKFGVAQPVIQKQKFSGRIQIELPGVKDKDRVRKVLQSTANLEFWETVENETIFPALSQANDRLGALATLDTTVAVTPDSTDTTATALTPDTLNAKPDSPVASADTTRLDSAMAAAVDTTSADTTKSFEDMTEEEKAEVRRKNPLFSVFAPSQQAKTPLIGNALVQDTAQVNAFLRSSVVKSMLPLDVKLAWGAKAQQSDDGKAQFLPLYALKVPRGGKPRLDGSSIVYAAQDYDAKGEVEVAMTMDPEGAQVWKLMTGENVGKVVAIVLDDLVYSAPVVQNEIAGGRSTISMGSGDLNKQIQEADDLANILKAGALPAPARIIDETVVGATIGKTNVDQGLISFAIALAGVVLVMGLYYARAGWIADVALLANVFFLIGAMASLQATLTLTGIAGIVLTIGMAVDANVLINERVREELKAGRALRPALETAFSNQGALSAIIDSNVTTFATGVILFIFGSGPIRGFATTLMIGIATSLFTAIFISRMLMLRRLEKGKTISFWNNWSKNVFDNANYDFMGRRKIFYGISFVLVAISIGSIATRGFNLGVDFSGGRSYVVDFKADMDPEQVGEVLGRQMIGEAGREYAVNAKTYGSSHQLQITTNYLIDQLDASADIQVEEKLRAGLAELGVGYEIEQTRKVDATISDDIKTGALTSVLIALVVIFIYIGIRFRNWSFGIGGLVSLAHDAIIVLGLYSLFWGVLPIPLELDEAFIGVILTVIGYSINDSVVVFDRIREYLRDHKRDETMTVYNKALNSTLSRTLNTGFCTLLVLLVIFFFGSPSIQSFVFGLFFGVLIGTYSSIFIGSGIAADMAKRAERKEAKAPKAVVTA